MIDLLKELNQEETEVCEGRVYSVNLNNYMGSRGEVVEKVTFAPLKRSSCPGCLQCGWMEDHLDDEISEFGVPPYPTGLNHGDTVMLTVVNDGRGFEDLYDEYHLEFVKVNR